MAIWAIANRYKEAYPINVFSSTQSSLNFEFILEQKAHLKEKVCFRSDSSPFPLRPHPPETCGRYPAGSRNWSAESTLVWYSFRLYHVRIQSNSTRRILRAYQYCSFNGLVWSAVSWRKTAYPFQQRSGSMHCGRSQRRRRRRGGGR